jgi:predicted small integral membrane protein
MSLEWMAWTPVTAGFFIVIGLMLTGMTIWELTSPTVERRGVIPFSTTRGDRFFIGLLTNAYIVIAWMGLTEWNLWLALPLCVVWLALVMRFG